MATKAPPFLNLAQNGHFLEHGWSDFYKTFESGFFDFKQIHITALQSIKYYVKENIWPNKLSFSDPPQTPLPDLVFRAALSHFLANFNKKKRCQNAQWIILHHISWYPKEFET